MRSRMSQDGEQAERRNALDRKKEAQKGTWGTTLLLLGLILVLTGFGALLGVLMVLLGLGILLSPVSEKKD